MESEKAISDVEYTRLINVLDFNDRMRNSLLTFSFTSVLAILGVALGLENEQANVFIYLVPYCLILPFTARISYYRASSAHITSFLETFAPERMIYPQKSYIVLERYGPLFKIVAWLVNHEMVLLSLAAGGVFWAKLEPQTGVWKLTDVLLCAVPVLLTGVVFVISNSTYDFDKLKEIYLPKWKKC